MPLDYSKWDNIEISDDEDIEVHPNVDKKSFIRWKQADIHRKREERRSRIAELKSTICKLEATPDDEGKDFDSIIKLRKELEDLENDEKKRLTVDNMCKPGFDKTSVNKTSKMPPPPTSSKTTKKEKMIEVLNPEAAAKHDVTDQFEKESKKDIDDENEMISTPHLAEYAKIKTWDDSLKFISEHPYLVSQKSSDEIMAAAFGAEMNGKSKLALNYVKQALSLQYCVTLGNDGVGLFFKRITTPEHQVQQLFQNDVDRTYKHIKTRSKVLVENRNKNQGSIFDGAAGNKEAMAALASLPQEFRDALIAEDLDKVNAALAKMTETEAKRCLKVCKDTGLLDLDEGDVVVVEPGKSEGGMVEADEGTVTSIQGEEFTPTVD